MGYRTSWIAADGLGVEELASSLGWRLTGDSSSEHDEPGMVAFRRGQWSVVVADGYAHWKELGLKLASEIPHQGQVLYFRQSDGDMESELVCLQQGKVIWRIEYTEGEINADGSLPDHREIRERLKAYAQSSGSGTRSVAYLYELPAELGLTLVGFRHDERVADDLFYALEKA